MKKLLVILLAVMMVMSMAACGSKDATTPNEGGEQGAEVSTEVLEDKSHAAWCAHGQYLLADGTQNGWGGKDTEVYEKSALKAISMADLKAIDENVYNTLAAKEVKYLYTIDLLFGTNDAGWSTNCIIDGKVVKANGSYAVKVAQCTVDVDGDTKVYAEDQWISDPKTAYVEVLTPATLFMPAWQEEADENGFTWADNPVVIGGAGLYTLVIAQYANASAPDAPGYGMALILKEAKEGIEYIGSFNPAEHTYGIIGGFNEWADDIAMEADGENTWKGEVELTAGTEFKVRADGKWDFSWGTEDGGNLVAEADGTYVVTITFDGENATVTAEPKA